MTFVAMTKGSRTFKKQADNTMYSRTAPLDETASTVHRDAMRRHSNIISSLFDKDTTTECAHYIVVRTLRKASLP